MNITVNNQTMTVPDRCCVKDLCGIMNIRENDGVAIAVGMDVLTPEDYTTRQRNEGDKVTIIRATCGG